MAAISPELRAIFCEALEQPSEEQRRAYLNRACQGDSDLRARLDALLLAHHDLGEFLEQPVPSPSATWTPPASKCRYVCQYPGWSSRPVRGSCRAASRSSRQSA